MTVTEKTAIRLILEDRPWLTGLVLSAAIVGMCGFVLSRVLSGEMRDALGGLVGVALLGVCFVAFVRRTLVIFDRSTGHVTWREQSVLGLSETVRPLGRIEGAEIEQSRDIRKKTHKPTGRPVLRLLPDGEGEALMPLHRHYTSGAGPARTVEVVNAWLTGGS